MRLYRSGQVAELDRRAVTDHGVDGYELMQAAGERVFDVLRARWPEARGITVCCGGGNNGGDGYVVARLARRKGLTVRVLALRDPSVLGGVAARAAADWLSAGGTVDSPGLPPDGDVIIDALLGTGLDRPVRADYVELIERINGDARPVLAVDVPSGLDADTGMPLGIAIRAAVTVSFIGRKRGLFTGRAGDYCGVRIFDDLGVPATVYADLDADACLLEPEQLRTWLPPRPPSTHKGELGHVLVAGGNHGMVGAVLLAARAALSGGSGLVSVATRAAHATDLVSGQPEVMWRGVESGEDWSGWAEHADVLALGPGLGDDDWSRAIWRQLMADHRPLVLDADGLNRLAEAPCRRGNWILTPHPGEAARLLEAATGDIQADRFAAARRLAARFDAVVVLKGYGSLIAAPDGRVNVCACGNPAMATAGMGDVLTGLVAGLRAQGLGDFDAASAGVLVHALAGDHAGRGRRQICAGDLIEVVSEVMPA